MRISKNREWPPTASLPREIRFSLGFCEPHSVGLCNHCEISHIFGKSSIPIILIWLPGYWYLPILGNGLLLGTPQNGTVYIQFTRMRNTCGPRLKVGIWTIPNWVCLKLGNTKIWWLIITSRQAYLYCWLDLIMSPYCIPILCSLQL